MAAAASPAARWSWAISPAAVGEDPFNIRAYLDILFRSSMYYGQGAWSQRHQRRRSGALDLGGNALGSPSTNCWEAETKARIPTYCTGRTTSRQHIQFGLPSAEAGVPYGPADGRDGMRKNTDLVNAHAPICSAPMARSCSIAGWPSTSSTPSSSRRWWRPIASTDGGMPAAGTTSKARRWRELKSTRIVTGEHVYFPLRLPHLLEHNAAAIWQAGHFTGAAA